MDVSFPSSHPSEAVKMQAINDEIEKLALREYGKDVVLSQEQLDLIIGEMKQRRKAITGS